MPLTHEGVRHTHSDTDETFIVLGGTLVMGFRDREVELHHGEMIVIPKGVEHKPSSAEGYRILLIEPEGVPPAGDLKSDRAMPKVDWV